MGNRTRGWARNLFEFLNKPKWIQVFTIGGLYLLVQAQPEILIKVSPTEKQMLFYLISEAVLEQYAAGYARLR